MSIFDRWKNKTQKDREKRIREQAEMRITLCDFEGRICIAFDGNPIMPVSEDIYSADIISQLNGIRENYVAYKLNGYD
jgi:hypothetical protein